MFHRGDAESGRQHNSISVNIGACRQVAPLRQTACRNQSQVSLHSYLEGTAVTSARSRASVVMSKPDGHLRSRCTQSVLSTE